MQFEWDPKKAKENLKKHEVSFDEAVTAFYDPDHSVEERRFITIGFSSKPRLLIIAHTERGKNTRTISARPVTTHERKKHEKQSK